MKAVLRTFWVGTSLPIVALLVAILIDYLGGRRGIHLSFNLIPALMFPAAFAVVSWSIAGVSFLFLLNTPCLLRRACALLASAVLVWSALAVLPVRPFLVGFKHRLFRAGSIDDLRNAAATAKDVLSVGDTVAEPGHWSYADAGVSSIWNRLRENGTIRRLDDSVVITRFPDYVQFYWGGGLVGHWGFRVGDSPEGDLETDRLAEDFVIMMCE